MEKKKEMTIKNHQYYTTVDGSGLMFVKCNNFTDATQKEDPTTYRLGTLNNLGLRFVMAFSLRHQKTELPVTISIFEEQTK